MFINYASGRRFMFKIYKELNSKARKANNLIENQV